MTTSRGFTLIEALLYLALFSVLLGGGLTGAFGIIESTGQNQTRAMVQEEGTFLLGKIAWALSGASQITYPLTQGSVLTVAKYNNTSTTIHLNGSEMQIQDATTATPVNLNNVDVAVSDLLFDHVTGSGDGVNPESVTSSFTLTARSPSGTLVKQRFTSTTYLRR